MPRAGPVRSDRPTSQRPAGRTPRRPAFGAAHVEHHPGRGVRIGPADPRDPGRSPAGAPAPEVLPRSPRGGRRPMTPIDPAGIRRILIRVNNWIGDVVMISPAVRALRAHYPGARVALLAKSWVIDTLRGDPVYDDLIEYDSAVRHRGLRGRLRLAAALRRERFDLAVLFQKAFDAAALAFLAGVRHRVGYATDRRALLLTRALPPPPADTH